jgi:hypothetical protein
MWEQLLEFSPVWQPRTEFIFFPDRKWRFDFALLNYRSLGEPCIGIEIEGAAFTQGRHTRGVGFIKDMEKYNHAALLGWRVLRFTPQQVLKGEAIAFIKRVLEA